MHIESILFGCSVGILVGIACGHWYRRSRFKRALITFGLPAAGGGGIVGVLNMLVKLSTDVGLHGVQLVTAYAVATVIAAVVTWWAENAVAARHNPPPEAEMTKEQWDKLTPRQRIIVRRRLQDKKSVKEVADELQMSVAEVNEELCRALQSIVS